MKNRKGRVRNSFCPTGEGGGVDPTCSPGRTVVADDKNIYATSFLVGDKGFTFAARSDGTSSSEWDVSFWPGTLETGGDVRMTNDPSVSSIKVLRQVQQSLDSFIKTKDPKVLIFTADASEPSRVKLYERVAKEIEKNYGHIPTVWQDGGTKYYVLSKGESPKWLKEQRTSLGLTANTRVKTLTKVRRKGKGSLTRNFLTTNAKRVLRYDPTRLGTVRKLLIRALKKRFAKLKLAVVELLLKEDALGLKKRKPLNLNAFCPTGEGGGVDPTCSPNEVSTPDVQESLKHYLGREFGALKGNNIRVSGTTFRSVSVATVPISDLAHPENDFGWMIHQSKNTELAERYRKRDDPVPIIVERSKIDPSKWEVVDGNHRLEGAKLASRDRLKVIVLGDKSPTANQRWTFRTDAEKIKEFQAWLRSQINRDVLLGAEEDVWEYYVRQGFIKGAGRSYKDFVGKHPELRDTLEQTVGFTAGTERGFLQATIGRPESVDKVKLLAGRAFDDLEGVTSEMSTRMVRHLTDGLVQGKGPLEIARVLADDVDGIGLARAITIAQTELTRVHAEGQLDALEAMGVEEVGVTVEWKTADDEGVCELCAPLEGIVLTIEEARGMLPRHPRCRCAFVPAGVGEDSEGQKRGQKTVQRAISFSQKRGGDEDEDGWGPGASISKERPKSVLNRRNPVDKFSYLLNSFCPTGPGGGIDPSCSPGEGGGSSPQRAQLKQQGKEARLASVKAQRQGERHARRISRLQDVIARAPGPLVDPTYPQKGMEDDPAFDRIWRASDNVQDYQSKGLHQRLDDITRLKRTILTERTQLKLRDVSDMETVHRSNYRRAVKAIDQLWVEADRAEKSYRYSLDKALQREDMRREFYSKG